MLESDKCSLNLRELEKQINSLYGEIEVLDEALQNESESLKRQLLQDKIETRQQTLSQLKGQLDDALTEAEDVRRSVRTRKPTERMLAFLREEAQRKESKLLCAYDQWKIQARNAREQLKLNISNSHLANLIDPLEETRNKVMREYDGIRQHITPSTDVRRRVDACEAVTADIIKIIHERLAGVDGEFDAEKERDRLRMLLDCNHARSIYGSTASGISRESATSCLAAKCADAAADVAAKEAVYKAVLEEKRTKEKIQELEEQHKRALKTQLLELECLQAEKEFRAAQARLEIYSQEAAKEAASLPAEPKTSNDRNALQIPAQHSPNMIATTESMDNSSLAQAFHNSVSLSRLPVPEPPVFMGDSLQFIEWKSSFMALIDKKAISAADKLFYLKKYVSGPARKTIEGTFFRNDEAAYLDAWSKLNARYGQPFAIQRAFRERLAKWPKIQAKDAMSLRDFSDFLNACQDAMPHVKGLQILNDYQENQKLVQKIPDWAVNRWNREVTQALSKTQEFPTFKEFAAFVSAEAEIACNPITSFHALQASESDTEKGIQREVRRNKARVFSTQTETGCIVRPASKYHCMFCQNDKHQLLTCPRFISKPLEERRKFIQEKKICYGCLKPGHAVRDCRYRLTCSSCKGRHPTCLHDDYFKKREKPSSPIDTSQNATNEASAMALNVTGKEQSMNTSMIVPVWVSSQKNPTCEKLVYALLDTQSDTTFVDLGVSQALHAESYPVRLKLTTMVGKDTVLQSERVFGLRVRGYESASFINLPTAYTRDCIPINRSHIPTYETAKRWSHLAVVADKIPPLIDCEIGLLIGYNCSRAMVPREVIAGKDDEPYAVQTDLGWSIVGCSSPCLDLPRARGFCHRLVCRELPSVTPADIIRVLESDFRDANDENKKVSQDDIMFLNKLKEGIKKNEKGHFEMPLPFKVRPFLPNNKQTAIVRLSHLKRKLTRDVMYKQHYTEFMREVIEKGDAEEITNEGMEGETWYLPHHGVYHPKKPNKLRVVFDCSARYKDTCLNDHLLQGPDLINNLAGILMRFRQHPIVLMCDIEKMFHQFHVDESDRNYLRFLWWKNGNLSEHPQEFRMKVHLFGATSSPGCANYGLKHIASENSNMYPFLRGRWCDQC